MCNLTHASIMLFIQSLDINFKTNKLFRRSENIVLQNRQSNLHVIFVIQQLIQLLGYCTLRIYFILKLNACLILDYYSI